MKTNKSTLAASALALSLAALGLAGPAAATGKNTVNVLHDEAIDGDLSDLPRQPSRLGTLARGSNTISADFNSVLPDFFTITVPPGLRLERLTLNRWDAKPFEDIAFMAMQRGSKYTGVTPRPTTGAGLLGWTHLRSTQVGSDDILFEFALANLEPATSGLDAVYAAEAEGAYSDIMELSEEQREALRERLRTLGNTWVGGADGFDGPLGPGEYVFWLRQGSDIEIGVELDFQTSVDPHPPVSATATLAASWNSARAWPEPLEGAWLWRNTFIYLEPLHTDAVARVNFFLDGQFAKTENFAPFDFAGTRGNGRAVGFDTRRLDNGKHSVTAEIVLKDGTTVYRSANFRVRNYHDDD